VIFIKSLALVVNLSLPSERTVHQLLAHLLTLPMRFLKISTSTVESTHFILCCKWISRGYRTSTLLTNSYLLQDHWQGRFHRWCRQFNLMELFQVVNANFSPTVWVWLHQATIVITEQWTFKKCCSWKNCNLFWEPMVAQGQESYGLSLLISSCRAIHLHQVTMLQVFFQVRYLVRFEQLSWALLAVLLLGWWLIIVKV